MNEFKMRLKKLDVLEGKVEAVLLMNFDEPIKDANYFYFTGNDSSYSVFLYDFSEAKIITNLLELPKVKQESWVKNIALVKKKYSETLKTELRKYKRVGISENFSHVLANKLKFKFIDVTEDLENIRAVKTPSEIKNIQYACNVTAEIMKEMRKVIKPSISENDLKQTIGSKIAEKGCKPAFFDIILNSGKNSAIPHSINSNKKIRKNEPVLVDFGCRYNGYHSDMTRMFCCGALPREMKEKYDIILSLMEELKDFIKPGMNASEVDALARERLKKYGKNFILATGHGVGLLPHEKPHISKKSKDILKEGMVFSIEPGIYFKKYGLRIEDMFLLTKKGIKVLTKV